MPVTLRCICDVDGPCAVTSLRDFGIPRFAQSYLDGDQWHMSGPLSTVGFLRVALVHEVCDSLHISVSF